MWNYRIVQQVDSGNDVFHEICEVYYDVAGEPFAQCRASIMSSEEGLQGLHDVLDMMRLAFTKPILRYPEEFTGNARMEIDE